MGLKWFQLVDAAGVAIVDVHVASIDVPYVAVLRKVVKAEYANTRLHKTAPTDLVVYANRAVFDAKRAPLGSADSIASLGESPTDPLIVQTPPFACTRTQRRWFQLVGAAGEAVAGVDCVSVDTAIVAILRKAVKADYADSLLVGIASSQLKVYANHADMDAKRAPLGFADSIESLGEAPSDPLIVRTPPVRLPPFPPFALLANARFNARECVPLAMSSLEKAKELRKECEAVPTWQADAVHSIQHLHAFMKALGGCTQHGKIYWRQEEKQIAAMLLDRWFPVSGRDTFTDKRVVLNGSSGVGKSTMFCLIAMHVAIVKKKNVLVVRQVARAFYAFFVGHDGDQVVYFSKRDCALEDAVAILRTVKENHRDFPSVCLMLDGFVHKDIPAGLKVYHLLTTSQQVHLKSDEAAITGTYLFPSWRPDDLFSLGESIYEWSDDVCKRFYYSGGSVRDFTLENADKIEILMLTVVNRVEDPLPLLCCSGVVNSGTDQVDCLRRTFVQRKQVGNPQAYLNPKYWDQAVDSAFAITELQKKKRVGDNDIASVYHWARANGSKSLRSRDSCLSWSSTTWLLATHCD